MCGGGCNTSPTALMGGSTMTAHAPQAGLGALRSPLATPAPTLPGYSGGFGGAPSSGGSGYVGASQDPGSSGFSPGAASGADSTGGGQRGLGATPSDGGGSSNAWMGVLAAGLGMMEGTSMSGLANIGAGASKGLQTYLGLQQQDKNNAYRQQTLAQSDREINLKVQQMMLMADEQQKRNAIDSQNAATNVLNANTTAANTQSEIATRDQQRQIARYQQFVVPGDGIYVRDLTNPTAPPVRVNAGQASPGVSDGASSSALASGAAPPTGGGSPPPAPQPMPTASAPPPQGGVAASGAGTAGQGAPSGGAGSVPATPAAPSRPQAGSALSSVQVPQNWQPTTSVPQGYVPANSMNIALSGDGGKSQAELGQKQVEGLQTNAAKATNAQQQLYQMNAAVDALPKSGLISPGSFGDERAKIALGLNTIAQSVGAQPVIDPDKVADLQEVQKGAFRLGTSMIADTNGAREAGFILQRSTQNVPSLNNSYLGFKRVAAGIDQANQYAIDKSNFVSDYFARYHHTDGADALFNKLNPWQNYAQRAIDTSALPASRPGNVPQGSQYSMSAQMWRDPQGNLYGRDGQAVRQ